MKKKADSPNNPCVCPSCFAPLKIKDIEDHYKSHHFAPERSDNSDDPCDGCSNSYGEEECDECDNYSG